MHQRSVDRLAAAAAAGGIDGVICGSPENYAWLTGFVVPSHPLMRWRHAMVVVKADGTRAVLSVDMEASTVRRRLAGETVRVWREFGYDAMDRLADLLAELGLASATVAVEMDFLPAADFARLGQLCPNVSWRPAEAMLARLRQLKDPEEIALLRRLSRIADRSIAAGYAAVKAGDTELDLAGGLIRQLYAEGAESFQLLIIATGERSVLPNVGPTDRRLKRGDVCRVEVFPIIAGYHAGVCRTAYVESSPPHAEEIWAKLVDCKYMLLDRIKPGANCRAIYQDYCRKLEALGLPLISFVGHGIGLHLHEDPYLGLMSDQELEAGMVLGIEPLIYETGHGYGMQNKDMVVVTETGCELLSDHLDTDRMIRVD
ncbi:MAG: aminopeptidase P family protein [Candidatus Competibacteraceae bacterium]|nr:aminopeptidase P family protein [Candidatus Competibacteraceae bacterium]